jgi:hypothetical protein
VYASDHTDENIYVSAIIGISGGQGRCGFYPGNVCLPSVSVLWYDPSDGAGYQAAVARSPNWADWPWVNPTATAGYLEATQAEEFWGIISIPL